MFKDLLIQKLLFSLATIFFLASGSQFNEELLIPSSYPLESTVRSDLGELISFEFWSFYIANSIPQSYPQVEGKLINDKSKQQLLFTMKSLDDNRVLAFMYTNVITNTYIIHSLFVEDQMVEAYYDPKDYEGVWIITVITLYYDYLIYETIGSLNINQEWLYLYKPNSVEFLVGGTGIIQKRYELGIFRGRLSRLFIQNYYRYPWDIYDGTIYWLRINEYQQKISLIPGLVYFDGVNQKQIDFEQFGRKFCLFGWAKYYQYDAYTLKQYLLVRITIQEDYKDEVNLGDEIVKITFDLDLSDLNNCGYDVISHHYKMPYLMYLEDEATNQKITLRYDLPYLEILTKWHFISFEYGLEQNKIRSQFKLSFFENQNLITKTYLMGDRNYNSLFINTRYYAIFGGDYTIYEQLKGQLADFQFISNYQYDQNLEYYCHYSCQTCNGPLHSNCLSCSDNNERVFLEEFHQCVCPIHQIERNQKCQSYSDIFPSLIYDEIKLDLLNSACPFGYFYLPPTEQCIKCPQWNSYNLYCIDCLLNSKTWYKKPICTKDFITQQVSQKDDAYTEKERSTLDYDIYYIDDSYNLNLLEGVYDYCDITEIQIENCFQLGIRHLSKITFVFCKENHYYSNQKCNLLDRACKTLNQITQKCIECQNGYYLSNENTSCLLCPNSCPNCLNLIECLSCDSGFGLVNGQCKKCGNLCKVCQYSIELEIMVCLSCIDNYLYYISLNSQDCRINEITNCLIAFECSEFDRTINSFDYNFKPYSNSIITKCAKCKEGYYFDEGTLLCNKGKLENCKQYFYSLVGIMNQLVCLYGPYNPNTLLFSFTDECPRLKLNCLHCVIEQLTTYIFENQKFPKKVSYSCLVCQNGYYAQKKTGQCLSCPQNLHCLSCFQQNKYSKDNWKNEIRAYYRASIDLEQQFKHSFTKYGISQNDSDYEILCTICQEGYELHENQCIEICPESCLECILENNKNICVKCSLGLTVRNRSLINNQCVSCSNNCNLCYKRDQKDVLSINPLFNNEEFSHYSYYCISESTDYFDSELGIYTDCQLGQCMKQIVINLNLMCNNEEYYRQLGSLETEEDIRSFQQQNILSDHLFSSSSFSQFETQEFYQLANEKSIKQILIKIVSQQQQKCLVLDKQQISQNFSSNIFTAIDVQLEILGNGITTFQFQQQFIFVNFKKVRIEGVKIDIEFFSYGLSLLKFKSVFEQTIELIDILYKQEDSKITFQTIMENTRNVYISNFVVQDCSREFYIEYFIKIEQIKSKQTIKIQNFSIIYSSFWNLHFFLFDLKEDDLVELSNINIETSLFNLAFINQTKGELKIDYIKISYCDIYSYDGLFQIKNLQYFQLNQLELISNTIYSGKIINLNNYANLMNLNFTSNELRDGSQIIYIDKIDIEYLYIENLVFYLNKYNETARFIWIISTTKPNKELIINHLSIIANQLMQQQQPLQQIFDNLEMTLIYLEVSSVKIEHLIIQKAYGIPDIVIINSNNLILNQIEISQHNDFLFKGIYEQFDCLQESILNEYYYLSISIYDVPIIEITKLIIQKAESINYPIIDIKTSILKTKTKNIIRLSELHFSQNLLLITNKIKQASLLQISSAEDYQIEIKDSNFEKNIMHQYLQIDLINSGLLFNFDCQQCTILLINLKIKQNIVINTFNSILYIQAKYLSIQNSIFVQNSLFDYLIIQPYLYWGFNEDQEIFIEQIKEKFPIKVLTGNGKIICQEIVIRNVIISNSTGSGLYINLEKEASLKIYDTNISSISSLFLDDDEDGGAFVIDTSISSSTTIYLENVIAKDIFCRNRGGLIYIISGLGTTIIKLQDIIIKDIYSLKGSILYCEFSLYTKSSQQFILDHLEMINSIQGYLRFLNQFSLTNSQLLLQLQFERSLFELTYAKLISIRNIFILSLNYESFAIISQTLNLEISNCRISNSTFLNQLLAVNLMKSQSKIRIVDFQVTNVEMFNQIPILEKCIQIQPYDQTKSICSNDNNSLIESPIDLMFYQNQESVSNAYCIINQINIQQKKQISSLLDISPQFSQIYISEMHLRNINCTICQKGLINVNIYDNQSILLMNSILFYDNYCGKQSCMNVVKSISNFRILESLIQNINQKEFDFKLQKYQCIRNFANKGTCLQIQDTKILIEDSILQNNTAEQQGGSIYVIGHQSFFILNSFIQYNKALFGGGLFLNDQIAQNLINQETIINDNIATLFGNNFVQPPSQLSVSIDLEHQLPKVKIIEMDNLLVEQVEIGKYQLFSKNYSNTLYVPNGQMLSQYQQFDQKKQVYLGYNLHLRLIPLDSFNNIQENLDNTECQISGRLLTENEDQNFTENFTNFNAVTYSQSDYNFDNIIFFLDDQLNKTLQIQFHCNSVFTPIYGKAEEIIGYHNNYFLRMNIKSLPCQLGEIKSVYENSCVPCNATQGLYSLVLNSNSCSQKDDVTTSEIKSAQLKLKPGFWRPYFDTDDISQCINLLNNCNGGWSEGDTSCFQGHIGALCEECDLYNVRGFGHYSTSTKYSCGSCVEKNKNIIVITGISLWTLISILITVRSNISLNEQMMLKRIISRLMPSIIQYHSNFGILIKMITNHLQILSVVFTFKFSTLIGIGNVVNAISNPIQTMTHSLDCFLKDLFDFEIHYSIMLWQIIMPFIYIFVFLCIYSFALMILKLKFSLNVITTTLIYMYIYLQPYLVGALISLISYRQISGFLWIQANVSSRYDTQIHYYWLLRFCIPFLIIIALIIPLYFFISLYFNKKTLHKKTTRFKWGYLYNEYVPEAYYWEIIKIVFKELLIIFLSYYDENVVKKGILLLSLVYIYQELSQKYRPYKSLILNKLDAYSANVCGISMAVGIGIYIDQQSQTYEIQIPCLIILITLNFQYLIKIFKEIVSSFVEENVMLIDKIKQTILVKIPWVQKYKFLKTMLQNRSIQKQRILMRFLKLKKYLLPRAKYMIRCQNNYGVKISNQTNSFN